MLGAFKLNTLSAALAAGPAPQIVATGGIESLATIGGTAYKLHRFNQAATPGLAFAVNVGGDVEVLLVGGGGSGGTTNGVVYNQRCGGGGGGEVKVVSAVSTTPQAYTVYVANGGSSGGKNNGQASTALGQTANGGGAGGAGSTTASDMDGASVTGGSGGGATYNTYFSSSGAVGTGTYNGSSGTSVAGGGGGGAGANGADENGGAGTQLNFTGTSTYYGGGGGGGGSSPGAGGLGGGGSGGTLLSGVAGTANTGGGGGGAADNSGNNRSGGAGGSGLVVIRYPFTPGAAVTSVSLVTSKTQTSASSANFVIPTTNGVDVGDIAILFDTSASTTDVTPTGWTSISKVTTTGLRTNISFKMLATDDLGATIAGIAGVNRKVMLIYRGNSAFNTVNFTVTGAQATTAAPTNQNLVGEAGPMIAFAAYSKSTSTAATRGWTVGSPTEYSSVSTSGVYVKALITNSGTPTTTVISMNDAGSNALQSFRMKFG